MEAERRRHRDSQRCSRDATLLERADDPWPASHSRAAQRSRDGDACWVTYAAVWWITNHSASADISCPFLRVDGEDTNASAVVAGITPIFWLFTFWYILVQSTLDQNILQMVMNSLFKRIHQYVEFRLMVRESSINIVEFCVPSGACCVLSTRIIYTVYIIYKNSSKMRTFWQVFTSSKDCLAG